MNTTLKPERLSDDARTMRSLSAHWLVRGEPERSRQVGVFAANLEALAASRRHTAARYPRGSS